MSEEKFDYSKELAHVLSDKWHREGKLVLGSWSHKDDDLLAYVIRHGRLPTGFTLKQRSAFPLKMRKLIRGEE